MQFIVSKILSADQRRGRGATKLAFADYIKEVWPTKPEAEQRATSLARENPGEQYAVMAIANIVEAQRPAEPKIIRKKINDAGEIVLDQ